MHTTPSAAPATQNPSRLPWKLGTTGLAIYDADGNMIASASGSNALAKADAGFIVALANASATSSSEAA
jgi:hypothetical protein